MPLSLLVGPANAGKVARLLERYLESLEQDPVLIVPNRADVDRVERDLLARRGALIGGSIGTFDDLFARIARSDPESRPVASDAQRELCVRRAVAAVELDGLEASARFAGFAGSLGAALGELESALVEPGALDGDLARLYVVYTAELDALGLWDRDLQRARAAARLGSDLSAWHGQPVFAYGFEDLTAAEWALVEALAGRAAVTVSIPYEPGRVAFASLRETVEDLAALADGRTVELPPSSLGPPALLQLERFLFVDDPPPAPPIDGAVRFLEGAGTRGALELVAEEVLGLVRAGVAPEQIGLVCPTPERWRAPLDTALGTLGIPVSFEGWIRFERTPPGHALLALLRFAWLGGGRNDLYTFLRSPYSGSPRHAADFAEGRLRGRAVTAPERVEEETERFRPGALAPVEALRAAPAEPVRAVREQLSAMARSAYGLDGTTTGDALRLDLAALEAATRVLDELEAFDRRGGSLARDEVVAALQHAEVRVGRAAEAGRVAVLDLLRARTRTFEYVFLLGLEEGSLPRRGSDSPFLDEDIRRQLGGRLQRPDPVSRERYLFYAACTRATRRLTLVREAAGDEGTPREPSPFWEEVVALYDEDEVRRATRRRPLSALTWPLETAPTDRERLRALATLHVSEPDTADAFARANGWERRLTRAATAFDRPTRVFHPTIRGALQARRSFPVTELERMADCSSAWFFERYLDPKTIDAEVDAMLRGSVAHTALHRFFQGLPKEVGVEKPDPATVEASVAFMRRCLDGAVEGVRMEMTDLQRRELEQTLWRDLEALVRAEAESPSPLVPRRFEVSFGTDRSAPELQRGLDLGGVVLTGKIDRIDVDPFAARGVVIDYKSGKTAHSAAEIEKELRLQVPLYMLVLRDLVGIEPIGGVYRPLGGDRRMRGLLRSEEGLDGFMPNDYVDDETFWERVEGARSVARALAERIREGDVRHDPRGGECPSWCDLWPMCRVQRA